MKKNHIKNIIIGKINWIKSLENIKQNKLVNTLKIIGIYLAFTYLFTLIFSNGSLIIKNLDLSFVITSYYDDILKSTILQFLFLLLPTYYYILRNENNKDLVNTTKNKFNATLNLNFDIKLILISIILFFVIQFSNSYYLEILKYLLIPIGLEEIINDYLFKSQEQLKVLAHLNIYFAILTFAILPAVIEETLFRGYLLSNDSRVNTSETNNLFVSSILFALLHFNPIFLPQYLILGLILGNNYMKTKNLFQCILLHLLNNLFIIIDLKYFSVN
jgi:membrane protease YdiL (CAAX protease family)